MDLTACRRDADEDMPPASYQPPGMAPTNEPMKLVDQSDIFHHYDRLVSQCMQSKGYRLSQ
jgi:hypothetical protein